MPSGERNPVHSPHSKTHQKCNSKAFFQGVRLFEDCASRARLNQFASALAGDVDRFANPSTSASRKAATRAQLASAHESLLDVCRCDGALAPPVSPACSGTERHDRFCSSPETNASSWPRLLFCYALPLC